MITAGQRASRANHAGNRQRRFSTTGDCSASNAIPQEGSMATRGKTTFEKRRKEAARKEKQQMKAERRRQRKLAPDNADEIASEAQDPNADTAAAETQDPNTDAAAAETPGPG